MLMLSLSTPSSSPHTLPPPASPAQVRKFSLPSCGSGPFTFQFWTFDDYDDAPRLLASATLLPPTPPQPAVEIKGERMLMIIEGAPQPTSFTLSCEMEAIEVGPVREEEVVEKALVPVVTIKRAKPFPAAPLQQPSSRISLSRVSLFKDSGKEMSSFVKETPRDAQKETPANPPSAEEDKLPELCFISGNKYKGELVGSTMSGEGTFEWGVKGVSYEGTFKKNTLSGVGKYTWADGTTYVGQVGSPLLSRRAQGRVGVVGGPVG